MKFLKTSQISNLYFGALTSTVRLRLRRLFDAGLIKVWMTGPAEENLYSLTARGAHVLAGENGSDQRPIRVPRRLERRLNHLSAIVDFNCSLEKATPRLDSDLVWNSDWQLKTVGQPGLVPDAIFQLRIGDGTKTAALEMDLGGEPVRVFSSKLRRYAALPVRPELVLVVTTGLKRMLALLEAAAQEPGCAHFLFTIRERTLGDEILGNIWTSPSRLVREEQDSFVSLQEVLLAREAHDDE